MTEPRQPPLRPGEVFALAFSMAALSGFLENIARVGAFLQGTPWDHGPHVWWMAPIAELAIYVPLALCLVAAGKRYPAVLRVSNVVPIMIIPAVTAVMLLVPRLYLWAEFILALGVAARLRSMIERRPEWFRKALRPAGYSLASLTAVIAISVVAWSTITERRAARLVAESATGAPNVLLLVWDTARASSLSLYGYGRPTTPRLDSLARTGVTFDRAISTASYTLPSHASIFTGKWADELNANWQAPLDGEITLAQVLSNAGYRTGGFSANRHYVNRAWGLARGFAHFDEHRLGFQNVARSGSLLRAVVNSETFRRLLSFDNQLARVSADDNARALVSWLRRGDQSRPYFAFVNFMEAHAPYLPREPFATKFLGARTPEERKVLHRQARGNLDEMSVEVGLGLKDAYDASIASLDDAVGRLLETMKRDGQLENTLIIVTADHGEEFGEHKLFGHGNSLYYQSIHVPLVVVMPGRVPSGKRVDQVVSTREIASTVLDLVGSAEKLPGSSLRAVWESNTPDSNAVAVSLVTGDYRLTNVARSRAGDVMSAVSARSQVIRNADGSLEAFDLQVNRNGDTPMTELSVDATRLAGLFRIHRPD